MYGINNSVKLFDDEITNWLIDESRLNLYKYQIYVYYKYASDGFNVVVLSYDDGCANWYIYEELGKWFLYTLGNILYMKILVYAHWFMYIRTS